MMYCEKVSAKPDSGRAITHSPRVVPMRQIAGDDVAHHALGDHRVGFGEHGAAGEQFGLRRMAAVRGM